ncbi:hypothetical protein Q757_07075 [Oenococcus alcoholitolerans]|uniref:Uncharacterized protein n=1 Tax=Oenococcus alcoholitolerans TaxID=931074 RepID=A0ABR4XQ17_9LACO|nr:hypothetical protein Q757_07075 [Oenococcus alcoholitolerans]
MTAAFYLELTDDKRFHKYFIDNFVNANIEKIFFETYWSF